MLPIRSCLHQSKLAIGDFHVQLYKYATCQGHEGVYEIPPRNKSVPTDYFK